MAGCLNLFHLLNYDRWVMFTAELPGRVCVWTPCLYRELPATTVQACLHRANTTLHNCDKGDGQKPYRVSPSVLRRTWSATNMSGRQKALNKSGLLGTFSKLSQQPSPRPTPGNKCFWIHNHLPVGKEFICSDALIQ